MMMAEPLPNGRGQLSTFPFQHPSPLDTLARTTSAKRGQYQQSRTAEFKFPENAPSPKKLTKAPPNRKHLVPAPASPLLHSHFARSSIATASTSSQDNRSYLDFRDSVDSKNLLQDISYGYYDAESVYSRTPSSPALRDSWQSGSTARNHLVDEKIFNPSPSPDSVPSVVVSSHEVEQRPGRAPIVAPAPSHNFSRPVRPPRPTPETMDLSEDLDEHKRMVLERNPGWSASPEYSPLPSRGSSPSLSPHPSPPGSHPSSPYISPSNPSSPHIPSSLSSPYISSSLNLPSPNSPYLPSPPSSSSLSPATPSGSTISRAVTLPRRPPSIRAGSPASSIYSTYSFYQLDSATPSPTDESRFADSQAANTHGNHTKVAFSTPPRTSPRSGTPMNEKESEIAGGTAQTPQQYLQLGIAHHEANRLRESAFCFEKSATVAGGCGVGMLMYGLTLRHGWGCEKNEKSGFKWLRKAAESAVEDLESVRNGKNIDEENKLVDSDAVQTELILAIYEVGQCFFHGWGVAKDQKMGFSYYQVAAQLGDSDAQSDLAFCLANGKGCKKDRKEAAKWYRAAVAQGQSDIGLAWIYKEKFQ